MKKFRAFTKGHTLLFSPQNETPFSLINTQIYWKGSFVKFRLSHWKMPQTTQAGCQQKAFLFQLIIF